MHTVTVSLPDRKVILQDSNGNIVKAFSVYVGSEKYPTLPGHFHIMADTENASSDVSYAGRFIPFHEYPDPDVDPTGEVHRIAVAGFHGWKYGPEDEEEERENPGWMTSTEGCIQMKNDDLAEFAAIVAVGDPVIVLDSPVSEIEHARPDSARSTSASCATDFAQ